MKCIFHILNTTTQMSCGSRHAKHRENADILLVISIQMSMHNISTLHTHILAIPTLESSIYLFMHTHFNETCSFFYMFTYLLNNLNNQLRVASNHGYFGFDFGFWFASFANIYSTVLTRSRHIIYIYIFTTTERTNAICHFLFLSYSYALCVFV